MYSSSNTRVAPRVAILVLLAVAAGIGSWVFLRAQSARDSAEATPAALPDAAEQVKSGGDAWELPSAGGRPAGVDSDSATSQQLAQQLELAFGGDPVEPGQVVDTRVAYRKGAVHEYQTSLTVRAEDMGSGRSQANRVAFWVTTEVLDVAADGSARVQLTIDAILIAALLSEDFGFSVDSRNPEDPLLNDPSIAGASKPQFALIDQPIQFDLNPDGTPRAVHGVEVWTELFVKAASEFVGEVDLSHAPSDQQVLSEWGLLLFPPAPQQLTAGKKVPYVHREDTRLRHDLVHAGKLDVTHESDASHVIEARTTPHYELRSGEPRGTNEGLVVAMNVVTDADSGRTRWEINRELGCLERMQVDARYQLHVSFKGGKGDKARGIAPGFTPVFKLIEQRATVERLK